MSNAETALEHEFNGRARDPWGLYQQDSDSSLTQTHFTAAEKETEDQYANRRKPRKIDEM